MNEDGQVSQFKDPFYVPFEETNWIDDLRARWLKGSYVACGGYFFPPQLPLPWQPVFIHRRCRTPWRRQPTWGKTWMEPMNREVNRVTSTGRPHPDFLNVDWFDPLHFLKNIPIFWLSISRCFQLPSKMQLSEKNKDKVCSSKNVYRLRISSNHQLIVIDIK